MSKSDDKYWRDYDEARDELDDGEVIEEVTCAACNGSGEGMHDGSRCQTCGGTGVEFIIITEES